LRLNPVPARPDEITVQSKPLSGCRLASADLLAKSLGRLTETTLEAAGEIELVAKIELRGNFLDRETPLMQQRCGAVDSRIEMKASWGKTDDFAEFFSKRLVGKPEFTGDSGRVSVGGVMSGEQFARRVQPVIARRRRFFRGFTVGEDFREHGDEATHGNLRRNFLPQVQRRNELKEPAEPVIAILCVMHGLAGIEQFCVAQQIERRAFELEPEFIPKFVRPRPAAMRMAGKVGDQIALADVHRIDLRVGIEAAAFHHVAQGVTRQRAHRPGKEADTKSPLVNPAKADSAERRFHRPQQQPGFYGVVDE
jgi:hypothetical protein